MLCVMSLSPGFMLSIFAGVVWYVQDQQVATGWTEEEATAYLGIVATLEERSHANKTDIVIPHDGVLCIVVGDLECVLED